MCRLLCAFMCVISTDDHVDDDDDDHLKKLRAREQCNWLSTRSFLTTSQEIGGKDRI